MPFEHLHKDGFLVHYVALAGRPREQGLAGQVILYEDFELRVKYTSLVYATTWFRCGRITRRTGRRLTVIDIEKARLVSIP